MTRKIKNIAGGEDRKVWRKLTYELVQDLIYSPVEEQVRVRGWKKQLSYSSYL